MLHTSLAASAGILSSFAAYSIFKFSIIASRKPKEYSKTGEWSGVRPLHSPVFGLLPIISRLIDYLQKAAECQGHLEYNHFMNHIVYIALGTNLGDRLANLHTAIESMPPEVIVLAKSHVYETPPWGYEDQPAFLNMVIKAETGLGPEALLEHLKQLEVRLGREQSFRWGPRSIDLDILFYDDLVIDTPPLIIPHPRLQERAFVLVPLMDVAPDLVHPVLQRSVSLLLTQVNAQGIVRFSKRLDHEYNTHPVTVWRLITTPPARGAWNMAVDEAILEHVERGEAFPTLRLYAWDPPCLSLGRAQPFADVDIPRLQTHGWDVVRRMTGGRAILHTDELTYSVTGPADEPRLAGTVLDSYNRLASALLAAVGDLGLPVEMEAGKANGDGTPNPVCFEVPSTYEITVDGRKLIGSAQARRKQGVLQHGSLPLTGDLTRICQALVFPDEPTRQAAMGRLLARATTVESVLGREVAWETAAQAFVRAFEARLGLKLEAGALSESELARAEELVNEKYAHSSWTEKI